MRTIKTSWIDMESRTILAFCDKNLGKSWKKHVLDRPGILLTTKGNGKIFYQQWEQPLVPGDMCYYDAMPRHEFAGESDWAYYFCHFTKELIPEADSYGINTQVPGVRLVHFEKTALARISMAFHEVLLLEKSLPLRDEITQAMIRMILLRFFSFLKTSKTSASNGISHEVLEKLCHYKATPNMDELARQCGMSRATFFRHFQTEFGCSPIQYRDNVIISQAKAFLTGTDMQVQEIAWHLNFPSSHIFSRFFQTRTDYTPLQWRRKKNMKINSAK